MNDFNFDLVSEQYYLPDELDKIKRVHIGIAGAGGLGSNCAIILTRCGFVRFTIVDFDRLEISNLNRQAYTYSQIGRKKIDCLKENLLSINPNLSIRTVEAKIDAENVVVVFEACDVVIEAFDKAVCKALIIERLMHTNKLVVCASGVAGYSTSDRIVTRKIRNNVYMIGDGISDVDKGLKPLAPRVMVAAAKQAEAVLSWVLGL